MSGPLQSTQNAAIEPTARELSSEIRRKVLELPTRTDWQAMNSPRVILAEAAMAFLAIAAVYLVAFWINRV